MIFGFIGSGNMGGAIIGGIINSDIASPENVIVSDKNEQALKNINEKYGVKVTSDNKETADKADVLFLCVKPQFLYGVIETIEKAFEHNIKLVRVMPNTPALVGEGMAALTPNSNVTKEETDVVVNVFNSFGKGEVVSENLMDAVTAVSGSSPAYVFMMIEAMADAAVIGGMPRSQAYTFAAQAVLGSAKMVLETGKHPGELKDMVCSPAGTTIDAVAILEKDGFRNSIIDAMVGCMNKSKELGKK